jgi:hypothetical protein
LRQLAPIRSQLWLAGTPLQLRNFHHHLQLQRLHQLLGLVLKRRLLLLVVVTQQVWY